MNLMALATGGMIAPGGTIVAPSTQFDSDLTIDLSTEREVMDSTLIVIEEPEIGSSLQPVESSIGATLG